MTIEKAPRTQYTTTDRKKIVKRSLLIGFFISLVVTIYSDFIVGFLCGWFVFILAHNIQCGYLKIQLPIQPQKEAFDLESSDWWKYHPHNLKSPVAQSNSCAEMTERMIALMNNHASSAHL